MTNRWNNLQSSRAAPSSSSDQKGRNDSSNVRDFHILGPAGPRLPSSSQDVTRNLAPHSVEDDIPSPLHDETESAMKPALWKSKRQVLLSSWRNKANGSSSSNTTISTTAESEDNSHSASTLDSIGVVPVTYEELLFRPPNKISFVIVNKTWSGSIDCCHHRHATDEKKKEDNIINGNDMSGVHNKEINPSNNSNLGSLLGVHLIKNPQTKQFEVSQHINPDSVGGNTLLSPQQAILLVPGDVLQSFNGFSCHRCRDENDLFKKIVQNLSRKDAVTTTLTFVCPPSDNGEQQLHEPHVPTVHQVTLITGNRQPQLEGECEPTTPSLNPERFLLKATSKEEPIRKARILYLDWIPLDNWLEYTCAQTNDVILSINTIPCFELYSEDANMVLQTMIQTHPSVSIKFYSPPRTRRESIKRAAIATAGGALVGTGAIIMATPLHPIGHAMALGGLGVLGTEFEAPKRAMTRMSEAARSRMRSSSGTTHSSEQEFQPCQHDKMEPQE
jgi:hypothetical protein